MKITYLLFITFFTFGNTACHSQTQQNMNESKNPLLCDIETGICEIPTTSKDTTHTENTKAINKPVKLIYYTDPICSSCWGI